MRRSPGDEELDGPPYFGMPEDSAFTIEGRIERAGAMADHAVRVRDGRERPDWGSSFATGLWLILGVFGLLLAIFVALYYLA